MKGGQKGKMAKRVSGRMSAGVEEEAGARVDSEKAFFGERQRVPVSSWFVSRHLELPLATHTHTHKRTNTLTHLHTHTHTHTHTQVRESPTGVASGRRRRRRHRRRQ